MDVKISSTTKCFDLSSLPNSIVFDPIAKDEVYVQILQLNSNKSAGPENIPINFFRMLIASILSPPTSWLPAIYAMNKTFPNCLMPS